MAEWVIKGSKWTLNGRDINGNGEPEHRQAVNVGDTLERQDIGGIPEYDAEIIGLEDHSFVFIKGSDPSVLIRYDDTQGKKNDYVQLEKGSVRVTWHHDLSEYSKDEYGALAVKIRVKTKTASTGSRGTKYLVAYDLAGNETFVEVEEGKVDCEQVYYGTDEGVPQTETHLCKDPSGTYPCGGNASTATFRKTLKPIPGEIGDIG